MDGPSTSFGSHPRFGNDDDGQDSTTEEESESSSSNPSTPMQLDDRGSQPLKSGSMQDERQGSKSPRVAKHVEFRDEVEDEEQDEEEEEEAFSRQDVQARPLAEEQQQEQHQQSSSSYDDDSWTIVCGALRVDVEDLRRKHDRLAQKEDETEKQRRGQLDCLSERVYQIEREVREIKELHKDAIDKAGAAFEVRKSEAQQDRQKLSKVGHTCEALKQRVTSDSESFTKQIETLHRWNQEHQQQFAQLKSWMDHMAIHEYQAREAASQHQQLTTQLSQLRAQLAELKAQNPDRVRVRDASGTATPPYQERLGTPRRPDMSSTPVEYGSQSTTPREAVTPPTGTPRLHRASTAGFASQNPWDWPNPPWRKVDDSRDATPTHDVLDASFQSEGRPLGFGSSALGESLRFVNPAASARESPAVMAEEEEEEEHQLPTRIVEDPVRAPAKKSASWWKSFPSGRSNSKGSTGQAEQPEIVEVNLYNT
mmetsp:Transcript_6458/g.15703  ORF Transcript_6458/g.15703 Transcript_6458/m.15703 type:complete len:481 (-) Transcript_6458:125-1567(-)